MAEEKTEGAPVKLKKTSRRYENYEVSGSEVKRKNKSCPKCGAGVFLAKHKDRVYCGKCGYVEFNDVEKNKTEEAPKEAESKPTEEKK
jgi:small subunit ribosomal protein S27Ae